MTCSRYTSLRTLNKGTDDQLLSTVLSLHIHQHAHGHETHEQKCEDRDELFSSDPLARLSAVA